MVVPTNASRGLRSGAEDEGEPVRIVQTGRSPGRKRVNLALQGGGAHGAFTWGVLDPCSRTSVSRLTASAQRVQGRSTRPCSLTA
jgi:hypothetical protein